AGAVVDPTTGNIFVATGNGRWDGVTSWSDAVIELDPLAMQMLANYTPTNTANLEASDADVGSVSPVLLDATHVVQGGKDGALLWIFDPGGTLRVCDPTSGQQVATLQSGGGHWNSPIIADGRIALPEGSANSHSQSGVLNIWRIP